LLDFAAKFIIIPMADLTPGTGPHVPLTLQGVDVGISICYEDAFGEQMRAVLPASQVLVNVSNDAWFGNSAAPYQHEQKARMRAREFARPMIRVTNTGISAAIDYRGNVYGRIAHNTTGILDVQVQPRSGYTPYARTGNWPVFIVSMFILFVCVLKSRRMMN
ncbi:MAG: apolipoprotein N-acyltransferase, partial [Pseudomonadales bacterium]